LQSISKDASGAVSGLDVALHLEGDVKKTKWKLTWLAQASFGVVILMHAVLLLAGGASQGQVGGRGKSVTPSLHQSVWIFRSGNCCMHTHTQSDELVDLCLLDFDYLVTKKKIEEEDDFMQLVNPHTRFETAAQGV